VELFQAELDRFRNVDFAVKFVHGSAVEVGNNRPAFGEA
jgi:hypothetical protein